MHLDSNSTIHTYLQSIMFDYNLVDAYRQAHPDPLTHPGYTRRNWAGLRPLQVVLMEYLSVETMLTK